MKICSKCKNLKGLEEFRNDKYTRTGKTARCKECLKTFKPKEVKCLYCGNWFIKRQGNYKCCSKICHRRYWDRNFRLSVKGELYMKEYHKTYRRVDREYIL